MRRLASAVALLALIVIASGCYHYHVRASGNKANSSYFRKTLDPSSEGRRSDYAVPPPQSGAPGSSGLPSAGACQENGLYEVGITSYWKYAAGRVFSFGLWSPMQVAWKCNEESAGVSKAQAPVLRQAALPWLPQPSQRPASLAVREAKHVY